MPPAASASGPGGRPPTSRDWAEDAEARAELDKRGSTNGDGYHWEHMAKLRGLSSDTTWSKKRIRSEGGRPTGGHLTLDTDTDMGSENTGDWLDGRCTESSRGEVDASRRETEDQTILTLMKTTGHAGNEEAGDTRVCIYIAYCTNAKSPSWPTQRSPGSRGTPNTQPSSDHTSHSAR